jgi:uncharacterized membrane protein
MRFRLRAHRPILSRHGGLGSALATGASGPSVDTAHPSREHEGMALAVIYERLRGSLFFVPAMFVALAVLLAGGMIALDDHAAPSKDELPFFVASTVDSARALLTTVATATITVAGIAFSVTLLVVQMASSQYSPRVVRGLFRDPMNKRVMGVVVGTFTYCLVVLQSVRGSIGDQGEEIVPNFSVLVALVLGVISILAVIAFINHNAHSMEVSEILQAVTDQTLEALRELWPTQDEAPPPVPEPSPEGEGFVVSFSANGWVQHVDYDALFEQLGASGVIRLEIGAGRYAIAGTPLAVIWPRPSDPERVVDRAREAVTLGRTRTLAQDPAYGIRQLADVGIRALSAGIDDPTTAQDAIFHIVAVLREAHCRVSPARVMTGDDDRVLVAAEAADHGGLVRLAFDELRRSAAGHPTVAVYLLEALSLLCRADDPSAPDEAHMAMREQAGLIVEGVMRAEGLVQDQEMVRAAYEDRFGSYGSLAPIG